MAKCNSTLNYRIDTGDRTIPSVHVQLLKQFVEPTVSHKVARVTSVFEPDTPLDTILDRYSEVKVSGDQLEDSQAADIRNLESQFSDILTKEPGLTNLVKFGVDTGDQTPIHHRAYSTPAALRDSIDIEIDWLLDKKFI